MQTWSLFLDQIILGDRVCPGGEWVCPSGVCPRGGYVHGVGMSKGSEHPLPGHGTSGGVSTHPPRE